MDAGEALKEAIEEKLLPVARRGGGLCGPLHSLRACNVNLLITPTQHGQTLAGTNGYSSWTSMLIELIELSGEMSM